MGPRSAQVRMPYWLSSLSTATASSPPSPGAESPGFSTAGGVLSLLIRSFITPLSVTGVKMFSWTRRRKVTKRREQISWLQQKEMREHQTVLCLQGKYLNLLQIKLEVIEGLQLLKKNLRKVTNFCKNRFCSANYQAAKRKKERRPNF